MGYIKNADELAGIVTDALAKGKQLGRAELEALQALLANTQKYRTVLYETIGQSQYIKSFIRDIPVHQMSEEAVDIFFRKVIGSTDPNDLAKFKNSLGFAWDPFRKRTWLQLVNPVTWKYTFIKAKDIFFSPTRYPKFTKVYWIAMISSGIINYLITKFKVGWLNILPFGETKSEAGLKPNFYLKLASAKTLLIDEGGLDDEQAQTIAGMLNNMLNFIFNMETDMPKLYSSFTAFTQTHEYTGIEFAPSDFKDTTVETIYQDREIFKAFSDWVEGKIEDGSYAPTAKYVTGVSDEGVQGVFKNMIPTVLASSQVTHWYDHGIHQSAGALKSDLDKLQPIIHWLPIPILVTTFGDGVQEILDILDNKQWMKSVTKAETSLKEILDVALSEWPTFPETLSGSTGLLWCRWSGHIPPDALATIMDGTEAGPAASPLYKVGEDQQTWLDDLTTDEFNRAFCLAAEGKCLSPYGWTQEEIDTKEQVVLESEAALTEHMRDFFLDLKNVKEVLMADPDKMCNISPSICELLKIMKETHNKELEN